MIDVNSWLIIERAERTYNIYTMVDVADVVEGLKWVFAYLCGTAVGYASAKIAGALAMGTVSN